MFLPQDRVQDFTKLNPQEILYNTQTSVCSQEIVDTFETLKQKRETQKNLSKNNNDIQVQLEDHINRNNQLHSLIENSKLKDKLTKECDLHKKKLAWLEFDRVKAQFDEASEDVKKLRESINTKKELLKPLEKRQSEIAGTKKNLQNSISKTDTLMIQFNNDIDLLLASSSRLESEITKTKQDFRNFVANAKSHEKEIKNLELVVAVERKECQKAMEDLRNEGDFDEIISKYDEEIRANKNKIEQFMGKMEAMNRNLDERLIPEINNCKRKISHMNDTHLQRFNTLRTNFDDAYRAVQWLEQHRDQFRGHIYNPVITEITVTEKKYAKYLENVVANRDLQTFLCTDKEDMRDLIRIFRNELKLQANVGYAFPGENLRYSTKYPIDRQLKSLGIYSYLIDVIDGPIPVINFLCGLYGIHNIAIGNDKTFQCASQLPSDIGVFFSTNHRFAINVSAYTGKKSISSNEIFARNLINVGIDQSLLESEQNR